MALVREVNKTLIGVVKQLESMRKTYRRLHQYEIPVGNPIETDIKKILEVVKKINLGKQKINLSKLAKLSEECIKGTGNDSDEVYRNIPIDKSKKQGSSVNREVFGGNTRSRCARINNKMEI
tara:strand:- start:93 stop:458 length:366 start_codon:yes stop_codon:yes gene_type:complete